jgi:hypothetical protein
MPPQRIETRPTVDALSMIEAGNPTGYRLRLHTIVAELEDAATDVRAPSPEETMSFCTIGSAPEGRPPSSQGINAMSAHCRGSPTTPLRPVLDAHELDRTPSSQPPWPFLARAGEGVQPTGPRMNPVTPIVTTSLVEKGPTASPMPSSSSRGRRCTALLFRTLDLGRSVEIPHSSARRWRKLCNRHRTSG